MDLNDDIDFAPHLWRNWGYKLHCREKLLRPFLMVSLVSRNVQLLAPSILLILSWRIMSNVTWRMTIYVKVLVFLGFWDILHEQHHSVAAATLFSTPWLPVASLRPVSPITLTTSARVSPWADFYFQLWSFSLNSFLGSTRMLQFLSLLEHTSPANPYM